MSESTPSSRLSEAWNRVLSEPDKPLTRGDKLYFRTLARCAMLDAPPIPFFILPKPLKTLGTKRRKRRTVRH